jgi:hypothetical protein
MNGCDDVRTALVLGGVPDAAHLAACPECAAERPAVARVAAALSADTAPAPPPALAARVRRAAGPLLERNAHRLAWRALARALGAALLPLPVILFLDVQALRAAYALLRSVLPDGLSLYVVFNQAATVTLLLALSYAAIPILAERQVRLRWRESHA